MNAIPHIIREHTTTTAPYGVALCTRVNLAQESTQRLLHHGVPTHKSASRPSLGKCTLSLTSLESTRRLLHHGVAIALLTSTPVEHETSKQPSQKPLKQRRAARSLLTARGKQTLNKKNCHPQTKTHIRARHKRAALYAAKLFFQYVANDVESALLLAYSLTRSPLGSSCGMSSQSPLLHTRPPPFPATSSMRFSLCGVSTFLDARKGTIFRGQVSSLLVGLCMPSSSCVSRVLR